MSDQSTTRERFEEKYHKGEFGFLKWKGGEVQPIINSKGLPILIAFLESECQRREKLAVERIEAVQLGRIKRRFNGFGGTLGFTQGELLALLSPSPKRE